MNKILNICFKNNFIYNNDNDVLNKLSDVLLNNNGYYNNNVLNKIPDYLLNNNGYYNTNLLNNILNAFVNNVGNINSSNKILIALDNNNADNNRN